MLGKTGVDVPSHPKETQIYTILATGSQLEAEELQMMLLGGACFRSSKPRNVVKPDILG